MVELGLQVGHMAGLSDRANPHSKGPTLLWGVIQIASQKPGAKARPLFACMHRRSVISDSATPWTVACQAPLSVEFSTQEYWSRLPFPPPGDLPNAGIKPTSLVFCIGMWIVCHWATWEAQTSLGKVKLFTKLPMKRILIFFFLKILLIFGCTTWLASPLVPQPEIKPTPSAVKAQSPNHWTTREFTQFFFHCICFLPFDDFPDCILLKVFTTN